jgi:hypothetical protein
MKPIQTLSAEDNPGTSSKACPPGQVIEEFSRLIVKLTPKSAG